MTAHIVALLILVGTAAAATIGDPDDGYSPALVVEEFTELPPTPPELESEPSTESVPLPLPPPVPGCPHCNPSACPGTEMECDAGAGLAEDPCGCCVGGVCGLGEGARCYNASLSGSADRSLGACGENMDCLMRHDLRETDKPEALCVCREAGLVCGSDNTTYASVCRLGVNPTLQHSQAQAQQGTTEEPGLQAVTKVWLKYRGPCRAAPWIVTAPSPVEYHLGSPASVECEVKGYPAPSVSWEKIGVDGIITPLPSDDAHLVVLLRGGPEPYMATSWLQFTELRETDVGTFTCVATNSEGSTMASTEVTFVSG